VSGVKHTPGPWFANTHHEKRDGGRFYVFVTADGLVPVCAVGAGVEGFGREEGRANARLIAAAPDLLGALVELRNVGNDMAKRKAARARADAAIAKATQP
jgi:hypothetical protein